MLLLEATPQMDPAIIKSISGSVTNIIILMTALVGVVSLVLKEVFARQKEQKKTAELLGGLKDEISKFTTEVKKEINENETATQKRISELELTSTRYFAEILRAHDRNDSEKMREIMSRMVQDIYNRDFEKK